LGFIQPKRRNYLLNSNWSISNDIS
jgi:hypothetical protein